MDTRLGVVLIGLMGVVTLRADDVWCSWIAHSPEALVITIDKMEDGIAQGSITEVLRDNYKWGLTNGEFRTTLEAGCGVGDCSTWAIAGPHSAMRYLILSDKFPKDKNPDAARLIADPRAVLPLGDEDPTVSDAKLMFAVEDGPIDQQAHAMVLALRGSSGPHSGVLTQYLAALLVYGPEPYAWELKEAIEGTAFLERAKVSVLDSLSSRLRTPRFEYRVFDGRPLDALRSTFVRLAIRYVLEDTGQPAEWPPDEYSFFEKGLTDIQAHVLEYCDLPHLDGLVEALQTEIQGTMLERFLAKLASIRGDQRVGVRGREAARDLLVLPLSRR
jgi:hypothetical protein